MEVTRSKEGRVMKINGETLKEIAENIGLHRAEVSGAINCLRLLRRDKLEKVYRAGYPLELFVFGLEWCEKNGIEGKKNGDK
jgi:hypothetical protein